MAAARKMDELLVSWLGSDAVYHNVMDLIESYRAAAEEASRSLAAHQDELLQQQKASLTTPTTDEGSTTANTTDAADTTKAATTTTTNDNNDQQQGTEDSSNSAEIPRGVIIPPFYPPPPTGQPRRRRRTPPRQYDSWEPLEDGGYSNDLTDFELCVRDQVKAIYSELGQDPPLTSPSSVQDEQAESPDEILRRKYIVPDSFVRITKDVCRFPSFFNMPLYHRVLELWNGETAQNHQSPMEVITFDMLEWFWKREMEPFDASDRFFRLVKQPANDFITRDDFLPFIKALLNDHPGLEFLSSHAEFQEKYAVTVITRIFYSVNKCHSGRITSRQLRRSDLLSAFHQVDEEEDINKVTRYLSYEHFYVLYCRFWELDHDRDYRISREDLLKYGDHSLSHMIVDRIFDAAPRPFEQDVPNREFLTYESFIYFMLSEEDKSNEVSVRYWFTCVDVDGDGKLNNMEMRSFYAVQLHRMQCMGHEIVPFEDMLCQMMDMIKPSSTQYFVVEDFLQPECSQVSGALFDALFNLNKYLLFEQRDPFVERQKREDEFECDWDRFACIDYNRLAMEEEAREEEAMEIDWVTVDEEDDAAKADYGVAGKGSPVDPAGAVSEAPF